MSTAAAEQRKAAPRIPWTAAEKATLRAAFPAGGAKAVQLLLPDRTLGSIYNQATEQGLRSARAKNPRRAFAPCDRIDAQIVALAQRGAERGEWSKLARRVQRPKGHITSRLRALGYLTTRVAEKEWTPAEITLLRETTQYSPATASTHFSRAGFTRSAWAIIARRKVLRLDCTRYGQYTARELALNLGQHQLAVGRLIRQGLLEAKKSRDVEGSTNLPYVITDAQVRTFIRTHPLRLDLRRVPPASIPWLIDVLTGPLKT
jgi:hypothetical protein